MKRGFLNKPTKTTVTAATRQAEQATKTPQHELVPIPEITIPDISNIPLVGLFPKRNFGFRIVTLPQLSIFRPLDRPSMCILFPGAKEGILALPGFPSPMISSPLSSRPVYSIRDVEGYGKGMFANATIQPGELIICERPLIILPIAMPYAKGVTVHPDTILEKAVDTLFRESQELFYALHNCKPSSECGRVRGIINTNCLGIGGLPGEYDGFYGAVCPAISRINHSCTPNTKHQWCLNSLSYHVRAIRTIEAGEQIFITYTTTLQSRKRRQADMLPKYGFLCACPCCALPKRESARSDIQRSVLSKAAENPPKSQDDDKVIKLWAADPTLPDDHITGHSLKIVELMEKEEVCEENIWVGHYSRLCKAYCALGDREAAVKWAEKSAVMAMAFTGSDGGWKKVAATPERTEWWGLRSNASK